MKRGEWGAVHSDAVGGEAAGGGLVLEPAEVVLGADVLELGVALEGVDDARTLDGAGALHVVVVGEEELLGPVELAAAASGFLGAVVPPDPHPRAAAVVRLDPLHPRHVRWLLRVRRPHQHTVAHCTRPPVPSHPIQKTSSPSPPPRSHHRNKERRKEKEKTNFWRHKSSTSTSNDLVGALDGVGIEFLLAGLRLGHSTVWAASGSPALLNKGAGDSSEGERGSGFDLLAHRCYIGFGRRDLNASLLCVGTR